MLVAYRRLCHHCHNLAEGGCLLSRFHFTRCHYFFGPSRLLEFTLAGPLSQLAYECHSIGYAFQGLES